jgi:hypothetical protein
MQFPFRIDATTLPALIVGLILVSISAIMATFVWRARPTADTTSLNDIRTRQRVDRQFCRRLQISGILSITGILIPLGDQMDELFKRRPLMFVTWLFCIFALLFWMMLLAVGDWLSIVVNSKSEHARLQHARRELEEEIRRFQATKNSTNESGNSVSS